MKHLSVKLYCKKILLLSTVRFFLSIFADIWPKTESPSKREKCGNKTPFRTKSTARGGLIPAYHCSSKVSSKVISILNNEFLQMTKKKSLILESHCISALKNLLRQTTLRIPDGRHKHYRKVYKNKKLGLDHKWNLQWFSGIRMLKIKMLFWMYLFSARNLRLFH